MHKPTSIVNHDNLKLMGKMTRCCLPTNNINRIDLCMVDIEEHLYSPPVFHLRQSNALKSALYMKK